MSQSIVDVQHLKKTYRGWSFRGRRNVNAVRGVSLQAYAGEVFGLLGPNGAGKTTLIKMLLGVVKPTSGTATLFGQAIGSSAARRRVGYLPESLRVDRHHTARTALQYYGRMSRMDAASIGKRSDELLKLVGLEGRDRESVRRFSKGMYQRLGLAQALLHDPDLLVLDEPTDGLDPVGRNEVRRVIDRLRESGKTIFLNSHILQEVELVCTRVAILARGEIKAIGSLDELSSSDQQQLVIDVPRSEYADGTDPMESDWSPLIDLREGQTWSASVVRNQDRLTIDVEGQSQIDRIVDRLREEGHSISRLIVKQESLEETFMRLVGSEEADVS
ncbi:ABC transporter ATP-binding protein [Rhodopirellula sp. MGV]|uniref:ABC transporter ATP-binding protein n=1 Tax=Rhodopirellula sp. MGV TaxID=2023130 RepID=UPI000B9729CD|nr:ABC transporter ATP-binding protein [Rhodopirellula sp. MGV]OYP36032.1 multidrug ABC transporter ATP-binding protein [Rhodopirellula sp. MGV]PNY36610.1 ABC transporter ATP-binding protein [Rhodopirellula baltica]